MQLCQNISGKNMQICTDIHTLIFGAFWDLQKQKHMYF